MKFRNLTFLSALCAIRVVWKLSSPPAHSVYGVKPPMCLPAFFPDDMPVNSDTHLDSESRFFFSLVRQGPTQV